MKKVNVAQIGVGYWGPNLLRNLVQNADFNVTKVVDLSEERREFVKGLYPEIEVSNDIEKIFNDSEIGAVVISTPVSTHYGLAIKALESGKHILVEKPMATTSEEIDHIGSLSSEKKLVAMVGHTFLFNSAVRFVKALIDKGEIGEIRYIYSQRLNLGRIRNDVDALWNLAPHDISIIQYWLNNLQPISVEKKGMDFVQKGIDDVVFMNIKYPNKIMANIHVSWLDPQKIRKMTIVGSKKMIVYDDISENKVSIYDKGIDIKSNLGENMDYDDSDGIDFDLRSGDVHLPKINWKEPLATEIDHFADCIINNKKCITDPNHAKIVVDILSEN